MKGNPVIMPVCMQLDVLDIIYEGHQGIAKCRESLNLSMVVARSEQITGGSGKQMPNLHQRAC